MLHDEVSRAKKLYARPLRLPRMVLDSHAVAIKVNALVCIACLVLSFTGLIMYNETLLTQTSVGPSTALSLFLPSCG